MRHKHALFSDKKQPISKTPHAMLQQERASHKPAELCVVKPHTKQRPRKRIAWDCFQNQVFSGAIGSGVSIWWCTINSMAWLKPRLFVASFDDFHRQRARTWKLSNHVKITARNLFWSWLLFWQSRDRKRKVLLIAHCSFGNVENCWNRLLVLPV